MNPETEPRAAAPRTPNPETAAAASRTPHPETAAAAPRITNLAYALMNPETAAAYILADRTLVTVDHETHEPYYAVITCYACDTPHCPHTDAVRRATMRAPRAAYDLYHYHRALDRTLLAFSHPAHPAHPETAAAEPR